MPAIGFEDNDEPTNFLVKAASVREARLQRESDLASDISDEIKAVGHQIVSFATGNGQGVDILRRGRNGIVVTVGQLQIAIDVPALGSYSAVTSNGASVVDVTIEELGQFLLEHAPALSG